jgi:hypothetical protein
VSWHITLFCGLLQGAEGDALSRSEIQISVGVGTLRRLTMGKNQQHKAMQRSRHSGPAEGEEVPGAVSTDVDVSYHTPEWHAARIAALTVERIPYEDWKKKQKEEAERQALIAGDEEKAMREYRAQVRMPGLQPASLFNVALCTLVAWKSCSYEVLPQAACRLVGLPSGTT